MVSFADEGTAESSAEGMPRGGRRRFQSGQYGELALRGAPAQEGAVVSGSFVVQPACSVCGEPSSRLELVAPADRPTGWEQWSLSRQTAFTDNRPAGSWWMLFNGVVAGNGSGDQCAPVKAERLIAILSQPLTYDAVHSAGFYDDLGFCRDCDVAYCANHWRVSVGGYGRCPRGHGKSLDPHWSPDDYD
jgi:hypothetical protein